ncbi:ABC transporter transmembrane domain-containing protein [Chenggangzhangella methanolivorans]|uniref:ABC transporter transmembrane domain-containing protein n=1 Tax=Chenggangzhangella methanolivorans TaxID=1437009 RepID=UPI0021BDB8C3|nr:ABC transporter ATP-binding protein [Chenggangzhangella methanolivorans]
MVVTASLAGIASQYGMKLLVDAMEKPPDNVAVWYALAFFVGLFALEAALWRVSGWLGCRTSVGVGVDIRLDLLNYATGHPMRFFQEQRAGSLGHRITSTAGDFSAMVNKLTWNFAPPIVNFFGAFFIFLTINVWMALALAFFAAAITGLLFFYSTRGRPLHRQYAEQAGQTGGEMVDVLTNIWSIKAFAAGPANARGCATPSTARPTPSAAAGCSPRRPASSTTSCFGPWRARCWSGRCCSGRRARSPPATWSSCRRWCSASCMARAILRWRSSRSSSTSIISARP